MMLPVKKFYLSLEKEMTNTEVFSKRLFDKQLLICLSRVSDLYKAIEMKANRKELMHTYVRGFKSILNMGIMLNAKDDIRQPSIQNNEQSIESLLFDVYEKLLDLKYTLKDRTFYSLFASYIVLGNQLGFNFDDISYVYEKEMGDI